MTYEQPYPAQNFQAPEPPLWAPLYGATFQQAVRRFFKKYTVFHGRASRSEYWWWTLVSVGVSIILNVIIGAGAGATTATSSLGSAPAPGPGAVVGYSLLVVWALATIVPSLALTVRRLHDVNQSGWLVLIGLVPFLGALALLVFMILPSNPAGQRFDQPGGV